MPVSSVPLSLTQSLVLFLCSVSATPRSGRNEHTPLAQRTLRSDVEHPNRVPATDSLASPVISSRILDQTHGSAVQSPYTGDGQDGNPKRALPLETCNEPRNETA
jgi:hypothetical protein